MFKCFSSVIFGEPNREIEDFLYQDLLLLLLLFLLFLLFDRIVNLLVLSGFTFLDLLLQLLRLFGFPGDILSLWIDFQRTERLLLLLTWDSQLILRWLPSVAGFVPGSSGFSPTLQLFLSGTPPFRYFGFSFLRTDAAPWRLNRLSGMYGRLDVLGC